MNLKETSNLLNDVSRISKKYSLPEPEEFFIDSDEIVFNCHIFWNNRNKVHLDIFEKIIRVYDSKNLIEDKEFKNLDSALKYVVQFV